MAETTHTTPSLSSTRHLWPCIHLVVAVAAVMSVNACGGGGGSGGAANSSGDNGGGGSGSPTTVSGLVWNGPVDGAAVRATCADGTIGGAGVASLGTYSVTVSCASSNYPIVIAISGDGSLAGPDLQFSTLDDGSYKLSERAPLKVAVENGGIANANLTALSTLAAQPIEDRINAYKAAPASARKPTASDVLTAEANAKAAFGLLSADVKRANPLADSQIARLSAQMLELIAVTKALSPATKTPEEVLKTIAQAAQIGGSGLGTPGILHKLEADGVKSIDLAALKSALSNASSSVNETSLGATGAQMAATSAALADVVAIEPAIKTAGFQMEQVARVVAGLPSVQAFDAAKNNLGSIAGAINTSLAIPAHSAGSIAVLIAKVSSESMRQAGIKAQEVEANPNFTSTEKRSRKTAIFVAAETIRSAAEYEITSKSATSALTSDETARAIAQVSLATNVSGDLVKAAAIGDIAEAATGTPKSSVVALAERVRSDIGNLIAGKTKAELGDLKSLNPQSILGAAQLSSIGNTAIGLISMLADFSAPVGANELAVRAAVAAVADSMGTTVNLISAKIAIRNTISALANSLNDTLNQRVSVGAASDVTLKTLSVEVQNRLLVSAAHTVIGLTKYDYSTAPTISSAASAMTSAASVLNKAIAAAKTQSITLGPAPLVVVGSSVPLNATGGASGIAITLSSSTPAVCTLSGGLVSGVAAGACLVSVNQAGNAIYLAAPEVVLTLAVGKGEQAITFGAAPVLAVGESGTFSATGGASGNAVSFSSTTQSVCAVAGTTVSAVSEGSCIVAANQTGSANYNAAAQVTLVLSIGKKPQSIVFGVAPELSVGGSRAVTATGGASGNPVTFSSSTPAVCALSGSTVTGVNAGNCVIAANQSGSASYAAAPQAIQSISIAKVGQTILFGAAPSLLVGGSATVDVTGGASGNPIVLSSGSPSVCTVSVNTVSAVGAGNCNILGNQAGAANYSAASQVTLGFVVGQLTQQIIMGTVPTVAVGATGTVTASGGASGNAVVFGSSTTGVCTVLGSVVTGVSAGTCTITANQAGNAKFSAAAQVIQSFAVAKGSQSIVFGAAPSVTVGATAIISATGGASGILVAFSSATPSVCMVTASTVSGISAGTCVIAAEQNGNVNYLAAAQTTQTFTVTPAANTFSGVCQVQFASAIGYVTNVASAASCVNTVIDIDGYGSNVTVGLAALQADKTAVAFGALLTCDAFGAPPAPGASTLTPCKR